MMNNFVVIHEYTNQQRKECDGSLLSVFIPGHLYKLEFGEEPSLLFYLNAEQFASCTKESDGLFRNPLVESSFDLESPQVSKNLFCFLKQNESKRYLSGLGVV